MFMKRMRSIRLVRSTCLQLVDACYVDVSCPGREQGRVVDCCLMCTSLRAHLCDSLVIVIVIVTVMVIVIVIVIVMVYECGPSAN